MLSQIHGYVKAPTKGIFVLKGYFKFFKGKLYEVIKYSQSVSDSKGGRHPISQELAAVKHD